MSPYLYDDNACSLQQDPRRQVHLQQAVKSVPSAGVSVNPANSVVARAAVLGSRSAEMLVAQILIIPGSRAFKPANVSLPGVCVVEYVWKRMDTISCHILSCNRG